MDHPRRPPPTPHPTPTTRARRGGLAAADHLIFKNVLELIANAKHTLGKEDEARALEGELAEIKALLHALGESALVELQYELQQERAIATSAAQPNKKKLTRKQQKRKAAHRRKAEARAAAAEAEQEEDEQEEHDDDAVDAVTAATAQLHIDEPPQPEPDPEPQQPAEPEPEECTICLNDLPAAGAEGAVLLACTHTFHADCLQRWKDKCLEKGLRFTCAMCRGAVVVVSAGAGDGHGN